jgi:D-3-phosphoglycerate dehydrogenase / 2-oxoglutarate reductase
MKVVVADDLPSSALDVLRALDGWVVDARPGRPRSELLADVQDADALIVRSATRADAALIEHAPRLRVIARAGTGVDNVDLSAASARGIVVMNAPGVNSVSVAEHACALMLALARSIASADASMKQGRWEKKALLGEELRGKILGIIGLGRIGQEVVLRARAFGMTAIAHDPFISAHVAADLGVELLEIDDLCRRADYVSLHVPSTPTTTRLFDSARLARCKRGIRLINTARGDLIDEEALADAIESGRVGGAGLDVFENEPPRGLRLIGRPEVVATPHIAASTHEALEMVGRETAASVRDFLRDGIVRNAVNFPTVAPEEFRRLQPFLVLGERMGSLLAQLTDGGTEAIGVRYYGALATGNSELLANAVLVGMFKHILSSTVTMVNARDVATGRGLELIETRSTRPRDFTSLLSVKRHARSGERWVEGTVFEHARPRLVLLDGVPVEAPLEGTLVVIRNNDQPGVIGDVGSILGRHGVNIASFALGRGPEGAVGVVNVDERAEGDDRAGQISEAVVGEIRAVPGVREVAVVRL